MSSSNLSKKELETEEGIEKIQIKDEPLVLIVTSVVTQWSSNLVDMVSFMHVVTSQIVTILKAITKEIGVTCPTCGKGQVIERKRQNEIVSSMVVIAILTVNLHRGISPVGM